MRFHHPLWNGTGAGSSAAGAVDLPRITGFHCSAMPSVSGLQAPNGVAAQPRLWPQNYLCNTSSSSTVGPFLPLDHPFFCFVSPSCSKPRILLSSNLTRERVFRRQNVFQNDQFGIFWGYFSHCRTEDYIFAIASFRSSEIENCSRKVDTQSIAAGN